LLDTPRKKAEVPRKLLDIPRKEVEVPRRLLDTPRKELELPRKLLDTPSMNAQVLRKKLDGFRKKLETSGYFPERSTRFPDFPARCIDKKH